MKYCKNEERIITGKVTDCDNKCIANATVILNELIYCKFCDKEIMKKIEYTTTDEYGVYVFKINILEYENADFVVEVFNSLKNTKKCNKLLDK